MAGDGTPGDVEATEERDRIAELDLTRFHGHLLGSGGVHHAIQGHEVGVRLVHHLLGGQFEERRITERQAGPGDDRDRLAARTRGTRLVATADGDFADLDERIGQGDRLEGGACDSHLGGFKHHRDAQVEHRHRVVDREGGRVAADPECGLSADGPALGGARQLAIQGIALRGALGVAVEDQSQRTPADAVLVAAGGASDPGGTDLDPCLLGDLIHLFGVAEAAAHLHHTADAQAQSASDLKHRVGRRNVDLR